MGELETADVRKYANAIAWHGHLARQSGSTAYKVPTRTSKCIGPRADRIIKTRITRTIGQTEVPRSLTYSRHCCRSITAWNFGLDESGRPNTGPFSCGGLLTVHSQTKEISFSGQFWAFNHYSRFVRRGARRFKSHSSSDSHNVGFENPDCTRISV